VLVCPAVTDTEPPVSVLPDPTVIDTVLTVPDTADPVHKIIAPLLPFVLSPVLSVNNPLTPLTPALAVTIVIAPELVATPDPLVIVRYQ